MEVLKSGYDLAGCPGGFEHLEEATCQPREQSPTLGDGEGERGLRICPVKSTAVLAGSQGVTWEP